MSSGRLDAKAQIRDLVGGLQRAPEAVGVGDAQIAPHVALVGDVELREAAAARLNGLLVARIGAVAEVGHVRQSFARDHDEVGVLDRC